MIDRLIDRWLRWSRVSKTSYEFVSKLLLGRLFFGHLVHLLRLQPDPEKRMTAEQALTHCWITEREQMRSAADPVVTWMAYISYISILFRF